MQNNTEDDRKLIILKIIKHTAEEGGFWAEVPAIPGCMTEGDSPEELENNLNDAIQGCLAVEKMPVNEILKALGGDNAGNRN